MTETVKSTQTIGLRAALLHVLDGAPSLLKASQAELVANSDVQLIATIFKTTPENVASKVPGMVRRKLMEITEKLFASGDLSLGAKSGEAPVVSEPVVAAPVETAEATKVVAAPKAKPSHGKRRAA